MTTKITFLRALPAASAVEADPIYAAIKQHRKLVAESDRLYDELQKAENAAEKKHGRRPSALIAWRSYSAIGASEIDDRREEFLQQPGADWKQVEREYRNAKDRARAAVRAGREWDKRTGVARCAIYMSARDTRRQPLVYAWLRRNRLLRLERPPWLTT